MNTRSEQFRNGTMGLGPVGLQNREENNIYLGKFDHDLTVRPHWKSWFILGE